MKNVDVITIICDKNDGVTVNLNLVRRQKIRNFVKNVDVTTIICDKNDRITVILNLVRRGKSVIS